MSSRVIAQGKYNATAPTLTDGQFYDLQFDTRGSLRAVITGNGSTASPTIGAPNDAWGAGNGAMGVVAQTMLFGGVNWERARTPNVFKTIATVAVVAGTPVTIWTPAAGKKFRLMGFLLFNSAGGTILLKDEATEIFRLVTSTAGPTVGPAFGNGILSALANNTLKLDVGTGGNISGTVFGTEE